jgi:hypothetical protein
MTTNKDVICVGGGGGGAVGGGGGTAMNGAITGAAPPATAHRRQESMYALTGLYSEPRTTEEAEASLVAAEVVAVPTVPAVHKTHRRHESMYAMTGLYSDAELYHHPVHRRQGSICGMGHEIPGHRRQVSSTVTFKDDGEGSR